MSNCRIRFFDNQKASSDQNITISTIIFLDINSSSKATFMIEVGRKLGGMLPTIPKDGYTFDGWYTSSTGGTKVNSETVVTNTLNLYPRWKEITATSVKLNKTKLDLEKDKSATLQL